MKKIVLSLAMIISAMCTYAEGIYQRSFAANEVTRFLPASSINNLQMVFSQYKVYNLDIRSIESYLNKDGSISSLDIDLGGTYKWQLNITLDDVRSPDYSMTESTPNGLLTHSGDPAFTYNGYNGNNFDDLVYVSILPDYISGFIQQNGEYFFIEPLSNFDKNSSAQLVVVYNAKDVKNDSQLGCGVTEAKKIIEKTGSPVPYQPHVAGIAACALTELAIAATADFVTKYGGATATQTKVLSQLNVVNGLYAQPAVDIKYTLVKFYAASSNQITSDTQTEITTCLSDFRTWGNANGFGTGVNYDVATLWVGRDLFLSGGAIGGYAYGGSGPGSGVICKTNKYNCVEDKGSTNLNGVLESHELGHNWGCVHQNGSASNIMNSIVQASSNVWTSTCISTISGTKTSSSACLGTNCSVGIKNIASTEKFSVYPNPASGNLNITFTSIQDAGITIYDLTGKIIYATEVKAKKELKNIDISFLAKGIYLLKVQTGENFSTQKFIVQ